MPTMTDRERFQNLMSYAPTDRCVYGAWITAWAETHERWKKEGWDPEAPSPFLTDTWDVQSKWYFPNPPFERKVIEQTESTVLYINPEGILMRERTDSPTSSMPQFVRFPVESRDDFKRFCRERMQPDLAARIGADYARELARKKDRTSPLIVISNRWGGFFGGLRAMVGVERLCMLFYDEPAFVEEMMDATADFIIAMMGAILDCTDVDVYGFWEDMACKTGPLVGPDLFRRFALPRYKRVVEYVRSRGVLHVCLDSDGNMTSLIPLWLDAGIDTLYPFEVQSGMDVVQVRKRFGRDLRLWFGIDKRALAKGPAAIDEELARVRPLIEEGGYVPGLDHAIPPDVPYAGFLYYMDALARACGAPQGLRAGAAHA
jgi:uroporphyrinogen-III decarboxylase